MLGGDVDVPTLSGQVAMTIPAGTQNNRLLRLAGQGHAARQRQRHGDQYVRLDRPASAEPQRQGEEALQRARRAAQRSLSARPSPREEHPGRQPGRTDDGLPKDHTLPNQEKHVIKEIAFTAYPAKDVAELAQMVRR